MANTYTQLYVHYVFAVQNRISMISEKWKSDLYKYINGVVENQGHKLFCINGIEDHVHVLVSMNPKQAPSDLMYQLKRSSSLWINENRLTRGKFSWQEGFGAFSCGKKQVSGVVSYIQNQEIHHQQQTFYAEYLSYLKEYEIDYEEKYIFRMID